MMTRTSSRPDVYHGYRFPGEVIAHAVWLYLRFPLSLRDVEEMFAERGIEVTYETVRCWVAKFGPQFATSCARSPTRRKST